MRWFFGALACLATVHASHDRDDSFESEFDAIPKCPGDQLPKMGYDGSPLTCLPSSDEHAADCGLSHSCWFNGFNFLCCPMDDAAAQAKPVSDYTPQVADRAAPPPVASVECPRQRSPLADAHGKRLTCLPTLSNCPRESVCWFSGVDYVCCPMQQDNYHYPKPDAPPKKQAAAYRDQPIRSYAAPSSSSPSYRSMSAREAAHSYGPPSYPSHAAPPPHHYGSVMPAPVEPLAELFPLSYKPISSAAPVASGTPVVQYIYVPAPAPHHYPAPQPHYKPSHAEPSYPSSHRDSAPSHYPPTQSHYAKPSYPVTQHPPSYPKPHSSDSYSSSDSHHESPSYPSKQPSYPPAHQSPSHSGDNYGSAPAPAPSSYKAPAAPPTYNSATAAPARETHGAYKHVNTYPGPSASHYQSTHSETPPPHGSTYVVDKPHPPPRDSHGYGDSHAPTTQKPYSAPAPAPGSYKPPATETGSSHAGYGSAPTHSQQSYPSPAPTSSVQDPEKAKIDSIVRHLNNGYPYNPRYYYPTYRQPQRAPSGPPRTEYLHDYARWQSTYGTRWYK